ncbi:MAG TPA: heme ABC exporter ATP-binding protein CcmA [Thermoplasmata archaeon]|nr:heme ABC exporter ATP-binding protein CcmA [Thermoplasmata archaeon]
MTSTTPLGPAPPVALLDGGGIECRSVSSGYLRTTVLKEISFSIHEPGVYVVLGPNGAGKTTLFRTLSGILRPSEGEVRIGGVPVDAPGAREQLHFLTHMDGIPAGLRVREALEFYARVEGASPSDVDRVLDQLQIRELSQKFHSQLSAGQRKRVSVGRVFLRPRALYLLDEPTANLDPKLAKEIRSLILELSREKIVLYSSHNLFEAREIGRWVLAIKEGRLALFDRIENLRGARFVVGVRLLDPVDALPGFSREGDYFLRELAGPEAVPPLLRELDARGLRVRELREMNNPLEDLFT